MKLLHALNLRLAATALAAARLCLAGLGVVVLYGVVMRYVFNAMPAWVEQVALLLVISVAMFGAATVAHGSGHIGLDSLVKLLPPRARREVVRLVAALTIVFAGVVVRGSLEMASSTRADTIPTLGVSEAWRYLPPIVAGALIALFALEHVLRPVVPHDPALPAPPLPAGAGRRAP
jgi:TRAP-type C4-dicarboxylate transport system permease small subunit